MSIDEILEVVEYNGFDVTFTGGDPIFQADAILPLAREIRSRGYTIWCFTGYKYEDIAEKTEVAPLLECFEVLVDGPFVESLRDTSLVFRGSSNQRLIDIARSTVGVPVYWEDGFGVD
jgi:anaerobic ribonucleoside-triphosphate reductase activating protein